MWLCNSVCMELGISSLDSTKPIIEEMVVGIQVKHQNFCLQPVTVALVPYSLPQDNLPYCQNVDSRITCAVLQKYRTYIWYFRLICNVHITRHQKSYKIKSGCVHGCGQFSTSSSWIVCPLGNRGSDSSGRTAFLQKATTCTRTLLFLCLGNTKLLTCALGCVLLNLYTLT